MKPRSLLFFALVPVLVSFLLGCSEKTGSSSSGESTSQVLINGTSLGEAQLDELESTYGNRPKPGEFWYDSRSGLYGAMGFPAFGFMHPGHDFGSLEEDASKGATGVIVNARNLPRAEWQMWSQIIGQAIQPGRYWFDQRGNAGIEGNPNTLVNFFMAARQNGYRGGGRGGDHFWSSRFSAGNSDQGGSRGYVSVPGYGPVGYGF